MFGIFKRLRTLEDGLKKAIEDHKELKRNHDFLDSYYWKDPRFDIADLLQYEKDKDYKASIKILGHKITRVYSAEVKAEKLKSKK